MAEDNKTDASGEQVGGTAYWMAMIPPWGRVLIAFMFMFTAWSFVTNFDLGGILNKYADASLEQNKMQFEAQLQLQKMQFEATEQSNDKLDKLISSVVDVTERMDAQAVRMEDLAARLGSIEKTVGLVVQWTCKHERNDQPGYCSAIQSGLNQ